MSRELKEATKEWHHAAEFHPIGQSMAHGTITADWWADWLLALHTVHSALDPYLEPCLHRTRELEQDLADTPITPIPTQAATDYAALMDDEHHRVGATYVFTGAHLMGGAITAKAVGDQLPTNHLQWESRKEAVQTWAPLRDHIQIVDAAVEGFQYVLAILEEIHANRAGTY